MAKNKMDKCVIDLTNFGLFAFSGEGEGRHVKIWGEREIGKRLNWENWKTKLKKRWIT